ncbi:hypothetical protein [Bacteroides gallinarum]|uniref:hypothetical protein n=1 Tax=Bacteroides gallinarum TaxID=376806 RepID=UPI00036DBC78|nr:hypothetical protein [Bacteroides gallinarum]
MLYKLLEDIRLRLEMKGPRTAEEQEILNRILLALPHTRRDRDAELLAPSEVLVRVCPDTGHPVLVCHNGQGQCSCLHNETVEEDAVDVKLWLLSLGRECNGNRKLLETVVDLAYNAGAENLWEGRDSRAVVSDIIRWAGEFETRHAGTDWDTGDYLLAVDGFYKEKITDM